MRRRLVSGLRAWWRWRMRRGRVHIYGIAEYRQIGTAVRFEEEYWRIEDDGGRPVYVHGAHPSAADLRTGDRVEVEPIMQGDAWPSGKPPAGTSLPYGQWQVRRRLDGNQT
jgi:hypothetical protein